MSMWLRRESAARLNPNFNLEPEREIVGLQLTPQASFDEVVMNRVNTYLLETFDEVSQIVGSQLHRQNNRLRRAEVEWALCPVFARLGILIDEILDDLDETRNEGMTMT